MSAICTVVLDYKQEFSCFMWQRKGNTNSKTVFERSRAVSVQTHTLDIYTPLKHKGRASLWKVVCAVFPCVCSPAGMRYSLVDLNKLFPTFLSQRVKMLFK
jgi:hypothetical protein